MNISKSIRQLRPFLHEHPSLKQTLHAADDGLTRLKHRVAERVPGLIRPAPRQLTVAITAACNLRCIGCRYGRDFMVGERLSLETMRALLDDAHEAGVNRVRLFGGEPLLHPDLPAMIQHATDLGMDAYVTTNGLLLGRRIDELYEAGLRWLSMGFYGVEQEYDDYTQRDGHYAKLRESLDSVRERYGDRVEMQLNWVIVRPTCNLEALHRAWEFALHYDLYFHLDLYGYSVPFFTDGPDRELAFAPSDREAVEEVTAELVRIKTEHPQRFPQPLPFIRSVTDWLLLGPDMKVPCDAYQLIWVAADGTVQLCDTHFPLGNLGDARLSEILGTSAHREACRDAFTLKCPNCTCKSDSRIMRHAASLTKYR